MALFDQQILDALAGELDGNLFEECICDLLSNDDQLPGLLPVPGGQDGGMDGAISDGEIEPYPLICTTAKDVLRNLRENLDSYLESGGSRRKVVLATSQPMVRKRQELARKQAAERGFILEKIYDRQAIGNLLRHSPRWCTQLLGLPGQIPALSEFPFSNRPNPEIERVGRDADLEWLCTTEGDRLLIGPAGAGKTYLLRQWTCKGEALFLVDGFRDKIVEALREKKPKCIIVDDAHLQLDAVKALRRLREELRVEPQAEIFSILATCWLDREEEVREALGHLSQKQVRRLELMTRSELLAIVEQIGPNWPEALKGLIVDQSSNKPGIAVTLSWLCTQGDWHAVVRGDALWSTLGPGFQRLLGPEAADLLALLSLSGEDGMTSEEARGFLEWNRSKTRDIVRSFAAGGVIDERSERRLAVVPSGLRAVLIKRTFFNGPGSFDWREVLDGLPHRDIGVFEIVQAVHSGAEMDSETLRELVEESSDRAVWQSAAALKEHCLWAFKNSPHEPLFLIKELLRHESAAAIEILIRCAAGDDRPLHSRPDHPLRRLKDWLREPLHDASAILQRRQTTISAALNLLGGEAHETAIHAACLAFSPRLQGTEKKALGGGMLVHIGHLSLETLNELYELWPLFWEKAAPISLGTWRKLQSLFVEYRAAGREGDGEASQEIADKLLGAMLQDLARASGGNQGLLPALVDMARQLDVDLDLKFDLEPIAEILFEGEDSIRDPDEFLRGRREREERIQRIATDWVKEKLPGEAVEELLRIESQSNWIGHRALGEDRVVLLGRRLAEVVESAEAWLQALISLKAPSRLVQPFVDRVVEERRRGWEELMSQCLEDSELAGPVVDSVSTLEDPPESLLVETLERAPRFLSLLATRCFLGELSVPVLVGLLTAEDADLAIAIAHAEWRRTPEGFRSELRDLGRVAILRSAEPEHIWRWHNDYDLGEVLSREPGLAEEWIERALSYDHDGTNLIFLNTDGRDVVSKAKAALGPRRKRELTERLGPDQAELVNQGAILDVAFYDTAD